VNFTSFVFNLIFCFT